MNTDFPSHLAKELAGNPSLFGATKEAMLAELITAYVNGALSHEDAAEVEALLKSNDRAKTIHANILAVKRYLASEAGKQWLKSPLPISSSNEVETAAANVAEQPLGTITQHLAILAKAITDLFHFRATLATASGDEGLVRTLDDGQTRIALKSDSAGRLWLRVTSKVRTGSFKFDVEPAPPILTFSEIEPGLYSARICVDAELAAALEKGVPKLTPLPPGKS
jgi:hypothetical protein